MKFVRVTFFKRKPDPKEDDPFPFSNVGHIRISDHLPTQPPASLTGKAFRLAPPGAEHADMLHLSYEKD